MNWVILIIISAILAGFHQIYAKKALLKDHAIEFLTILSIMGAILSLFFLPKASFDFPIKFYLLIFVAAFICAMAGILFAKALRHMEVSSVAPMQNLSPLFLLIIGFIFLGEKLTLLQIGGIFILMFGAYFIEIKHNSKSILDPFKEVIKSKYTIFIMLALVIYAVSAALEKYILSNGVGVYTLLITYRLISAVIFIFITFVFYKGFDDIYHGIKETGIVIGFLALIGIGASYFYYQALNLAYVSLVIPIKRLSTLITTIIGGEMFHEHNLTHKMIGCAIMIAGAVCIAI